MLEPDVVFLVFFPPLLYAGAWNTSWREFSRNLVDIASLAVGLVAVTVAGVAVFAARILPGFDWRTGFVLGAVVSTTDAIAATSVARGPVGGLEKILRAGPVTGSNRRAACSRVPWLLTPLLRLHDRRKPYAGGPP